MALDYLTTAGKHGGSVLRLRVVALALFSRADRGLVVLLRGRAAHVARRASTHYCIVWSTALLYNSVVP